MISETIKQHLITQQMNLESCLNALQANSEANKQIAKRLSQLEERTTTIENNIQLLMDSVSNWQTLEDDLENLLEEYKNTKLDLNGLVSEFKSEMQRFSETPQQLGEALKKFGNELKSLK